jgi:hypothetical protein
MSDASRHDNDSFKRPAPLDIHDDRPDARELEGEILARADARETDILDDSAADDRGQRVGRILTTKDLLPASDPQFTARLGIEPPGTRVILGSLVGVVNSTERKITMWQGKELESVWLNGEFEMVMRQTGEVKAAPTAILPKAFGITIETALAGLKRNGAGDGAELTIDCDIGLEATGRPIPYEWVVIYYREGKAQKAMRDARGRREARLARQAQKALPAA